MDLGEYLDSAKRSLFRFEFLQEFDIPSEREAAELWKREGKIDIQHMHEWWDFIASKTKQGVCMQRVRLVTYPLTDYTKRELAVFRETRKYGDDICIIIEEVFNPLCIPHKDFWLIDDIIALDMQYSPAGSYLGCVPQEAKSYILSRAALLENATTLEKFIGLGI